jgi:carbamoyltransferase
VVTSATRLPLYQGGYQPDIPTEATKKVMMNVLGIAALYHDSSCCILIDGKLRAAAQEERFSRIKYDSRIPKEAVRYCLKEAGLTIHDIDYVAYYEDPTKKLSRQLWMLAQGLPFDDQLINRMDPHRPEQEIRDIMGYEGPIEYMDHHLAHAAGTFCFSGFPEAAIFTVDSVGEWATTTLGRGSQSGIELLDEIHFPNSFGLLYSTMTSYLGFDVNDGEYKVMGLAPYGTPRYTDQVWKLIESNKSSQLQLQLDYFDFLAGQRMFSDKLIELFKQPPRSKNDEITQFHQDVAKSMQVVLEDLLLEKVRYLYEKVPSQNLCMSGGVALNCVANGRIHREGPYTNLFIQPASGDAGSSLGAAAYVHAKYDQSSFAGERMEHVYLGPGYTSEEITRLVQETPLPFEDYHGNFDALCTAVSKRLAEGQIIGWYQGRMEFGPRALGARSIIADPRRPEMRDKINALVKKREAFRPFAPVVLYDKAREHFDLDCPSPFMLLVCQVCSPLELPAITHIDGSARVQTVTEQYNPRFAGLLRHFDQETGCPILLNTSFNMKDEPIVCTPVDAIRCFVRSKMDALVLQDIVIDQKSVPAFWDETINFFEGPKSANIDHSVYTFF